MNSVKYSLYFGYALTVGDALSFFHLCLLFTHHSHTKINFVIILLENIKNLPFSFPIKHVTTLKISVTLNPPPDIDLCVSH